jgi:Leucine-rich repeat (LRR) protein
LPASYGNLAALERLSLNDNTFTGHIPREWSGMTALQKLYLYNNPQLSGCVPQGLEEQLQMSLGFELKDYVEEGTKVEGYCKA